MHAFPIIVGHVPLECHVNNEEKTATILYWDQDHELFTVWDYELDTEHLKNSVFIDIRSHYASKEDFYANPSAELMEQAVSSAYDAALDEFKKRRRVSVSKFKIDAASCIMSKNS